MRLKLRLAALLALGSLCVGFGGTASHAQQSAQQLYIAAEGALAAQELDKAERLIGAAEKALGDNNARLTSVRMNIAWKRGNFQKAQELANKFLAFKPAPALLDEYRGMLGEVEEQARAERRAAENWNLVRDMTFTNNGSSSHFSFNSEFSMVANRDGSFSSFGSTRTFNGSDPTFFRTYPAGARGYIQLSSKAYPLVATTDGAFAWLERKNRKKNFTLIKQSGSNKKIFKKTISGTTWTWSEHMTPIGDNGYAVVWQPRTKKARSNQLMVQMVAKDGRMGARKKYTIPANKRQVNSINIQATNDGGLIILLTSRIDRSKDIRWAIQLDSDGTIQKKWDDDVPPVRIRNKFIEMRSGNFIFPARDSAKILLFDQFGKTSTVKNFSFEHEQIDAQGVAIVRHPAGGFLYLTRVNNFDKSKGQYNSYRGELLHLNEDWIMLSRLKVGVDGFEPKDMAINKHGMIAISGHNQRPSSSRIDGYTTTPAQYYYKWIQ